MPNRTVSVRLDANVGGFVSAAGRAETTARSLHTSLTRLVTGFEGLQRAARSDAGLSSLRTHLTGVGAAFSDMHRAMSSGSGLSGLHADLERINTALTTTNTHAHTVADAWTHMNTALSTTTTHAHTLATAWAGLQGAMHGAGGGAVQIVNQFNNIDNSVRTTNRTMNDYRQITNNTNRTINDSRAITNNYNRTVNDSRNIINNTSRTTNDYRNIVNNTTRNVQNLGSTVRILNHNMASADGSHAAHQIGLVGAAAERSRVLMRGMVGGLAAFGGVALVGAGIKSVMQEGNDFVNSLNELNAVAAVTPKELAAISAEARNLGRDSTIAGASSVDAAHAMTELVKGGLSVADAMIAARGTLQLAAAAQVDAAKAAEIQANALAAFHLGAAKATHVADLFANAANATSADIGDIAYAMKNVGGVAYGLYGVSIDQVTTALGLMANAGVKGADAGTMLKSMMLALAHPSSTAAKGMRALGLQINDSKGHFVGLRSIWDQLNVASKHMTEQQYRAAASMLFGSYGVTVAGFAAKTSVKDWDDLAKKLEATGGASKMAAAKMAGLPGTIEAFKNTLSDVKLSLYYALGPVATKFMQMFGQGLDAIAPHLQKFSDWAAKALPRAFDVAKTSVQSFMTGLKGGNTGGLDGIQAKFGKFGEAVREVFDNLKPIAENVWSFVRTVAPAFGQLVAAWAPLAGFAGKSLIVMFQGLGTVLAAVAPFVAGMLRLLADTLNALRPALQWVAPAMYVMWAAFKGYTILRAATLAVGAFGTALGTRLGAGAARATTALAMFNMRGGATYAQTAAWAGRIQTATTVATRLGNALPIVGIAAVAFGSVLEMQSAKLDEAAKRGADLAAQFRQGGNAAKQAALEVAQAEATVNAERKKSAGSQALDILTFQSNGADEAAAKVKAYKSSLDDWNKTASVTEQNDAKVTEAENNYQAALQKYGSTTAPAVIAASQALTIARANQKTAADALAEAEKSITDRMLEQTNAILAAANAEVAKTQATAAVNAAELSYITTMDDGNATSQERVDSTNALITAYTQKIQTMLDGAKGEAEQQKAVSDSIGLLMEQKKTIEAAGHAFPPAAQEMLSSLILTRAGVSETSGVFEALKGHILGIPNSKTIKTDALTQDTIDKLKAVGLSVNENAKDHTFTVTANYVEIHTRYDGDTRFTGGHAKGGWIHGPGTATSDNILTPLSPNEFVVNAADAQKNASLLERINRGGGVMGTGKLGMPQYAELGGSASAQQSLGAPARPIVINLNHSTTLDSKVVARSVNRYNADLARRA